MNEEPAPSGAEAPEASAVSPEAEPSAPPPVTPAARPAPAGMPAWLGYALAAIVPALIVGALVFFLRDGGSGGGGNVLGVLDGFVRLSVGSGESIESYEGAAPPGYPEDFPLLDGADIVASFSIASADGTTFIVAYSTTDSIEETYAYYLENLDADPWQIELARSASEFTGLQFSRPDSADVAGSVTINEAALDGSTSVFVFLQDISQRLTEAEDYVAPESRDLPPDFPDDVSIYEDGDSVIIDAYFQRDAGTNSYLITFITEDSDIDVINYYTKQFQDSGWNVVDSELEAGDFALSIDFDDGDPQDLSGSIRADPFSQDSNLTEITMIVQVSATRGRGN